MMRGERSMATAVRDEKGNIVVEQVYHADKRETQDISSAFHKRYIQFFRLYGKRYEDAYALGRSI